MKVYEKDKLDVVLKRDESFLRVRNMIIINPEQFTKSIQITTRNLISDQNDFVFLNLIPSQVQVDGISFSFDVISFLWDSKLEGNFITSPDVTIRTSLNSVVKK